MRRAFTLVLPLALAGCNDAGSGGGSGGTSGPDTAATGGATTDGTGGTMGTGGTSGGTTTGGAPVDIPARGIQVDWIEVNQGVGVPVAVGGVWQDGASRNAQLVTGRDTLVRGFWTTDADFVDREIEARLTLSYPDGTDVVKKSVVDTAVGSNPKYLSRSWYWDIPADRAESGVEFQVELFETDMTWDDGMQPLEPPRSPADGPGLIGFQDGHLAMKVMMVPVDVQWGSCSKLVDTSPEVIEQFHDEMLQRNPLVELDIQVHPTPILMTQEPASLWEFMAILQDYRTQDGADANTYYYAVMDACGAGDIDGAGGMAFATPSDAMDEAYMRVAVGLFQTFAMNFTTTTFVHEVGHLQGMNHVPCDGNPAPPGDWNPAYPDSDGSIVAWGFGIRSLEIHDPAKVRDYMSYCYDDNWVGDWTWRWTYDRILELTSWDDMPSKPDPDARVLTGIVGDNGEELWNVTVGKPPRDGTPAGVLRLSTAEGQVEVGAVELPVPDHDARIVTISLPVAPTELTAIEHVEGEGARTIPLDRVRVGGVRLGSPR